MSKYIRLYENIRDEIIGGAYPFGGRLPSKRAMAEDRNISVITVEHAYELLEEEGYIEARERSGYYVSYSVKNVFPVAKRRAPGGEKAPVYEENSIPYPVYAKTLRQVLSQRGEELLTKSPGFGTAALREAVAAYLRRSRNLPADPGRIIVGSGAEYLYGMVIKVLGRDRIYGIENPSYENIAAVYEAENVTVERLPIGVDGIESGALSQARAEVLHVSPYRSYPTGVTASAAKKREYINWQKKRGAVIIEDDFESEFSPLRKPEETLYALTGGRNVLYINTFSRTVSPAVRAAYMLVPEDMMPEFEKKLGFYSCPVPVTEQYLLAELLENGSFERHINRVRRKNREKR